MKLPRDSVQVANNLAADLLRLAEASDATYAEQQAALDVVSVFLRLNHLDVVSARLDKSDEPEA